ncbi:MAG: hypothetical protein BMS9Abin02_0779 [Anaerolineae bacterium]|nr:MAG: hypothetical protein BMS9Abin02_0779 [Anaerolineae bacterium]
MRKTVKVLLLIFLLSMVCYFSGLSYFVVCNSPDQNGKLGLISKIPLPETSQYQETCNSSGFDLNSAIGDSFEIVFLGWAVVGGIWMIMILRDISESLRLWQEFRH